MVTQLAKPQENSLLKVSEQLGGRFGLPQHYTVVGEIRRVEFGQEKLVTSMKSVCPSSLPYILPSILSSLSFPVLNSGTVYICFQMRLLE